MSLFLSLPISQVQPAGGSASAESALGELARRLLPLTSPDDITAVGCEILKGHLALSGVAFCAPAGLHDALGPEDVAELHCGREVVSDHALTIPLVREGRLVAVCHLRAPGVRHWSKAEVQLAHDVAQWTWFAAGNATTQAALRAERITQQELAAAALSDSERRQDELFAMLAHELRNPLAPIAMAAEILKHPDLDQKSIQNVSALIQRQSRHISALLADLLDMSRINLGLVTLDTATLLLDDILTDAIEQTRPMMLRKSQSFAFLASAQPVRIDGDENRMVQVFANVLNNASKYTPAGGSITLAVHVADGQAIVTVSDTGDGMSGELIPHVFDMFTQARRSSDRMTGGLGLGLSLVKNLVVLQGGTVHARSAGLGKGSEFIVTFPVCQPQPKVKSATLKVMVVDDNIDAGLALAGLLELDGHAVSVVHTAEEALQQVKTDAPEVFILDIGLPGIDGYGLAKKMRASAATAGALLIALTSYGQRGDRQKSTEAGFDFQLEKPVDPSQLLDAVGRAGQQRA